jgi:hypothetical protein
MLFANTENGHVFDIEILLSLWMQDMQQNYYVSG